MSFSSWQLAAPIFGLSIWNILIPVVLLAIVVVLIVVRQMQKK